MSGMRSDTIEWKNLSSIIFHTIMLFSCLTSIAIKSTIGLGGGGSIRPLNYYIIDLKQKEKKGDPSLFITSL